MKVYMCGHVKLNTDEKQNYIQLISDMCENIKTNDSLYEKFRIHAMREIRNWNGVPNKILTIAKRSDDNKWCLLVFDHEPVNKVFAVKVNEDGRFYIDI